VDIAGLEKAELHCHIDGLLDAAMVQALRDEGRDLGLPCDALAAVCPVDSAAGWERYRELVEPYLQPHGQRLAWLLAHHLRRLVAQRVGYAEIFVSGMLFPRGEDPAAYGERFRALRAVCDAFAPHLQVGLVACIGRGPPHRLERQAAAILALHREQLVCGVALAGDELAGPIAPSRAIFERFRGEGLGIEIHAGEIGGADSVRDAIEHGFPHRLGHGLPVVADPALVDLVRERQIHLELCPTSNLRLGVVTDITRHPIARALEVGLPLSINTDDPGPFGCSLTSEYQLVRDTFGFEDADFARILAWTKAAAFLPPTARDVPI
jgi:adenosine deaminase